MAVLSTSRWVVALLCSGAVAACAADTPPVPFLKASREAAGFALENPYYRLIIDPVRGGAVRSFVFKPFDPQKEFVPVKGAKGPDLGVVR